MVVNCQEAKDFPCHYFLRGYAFSYIPEHMPDQNLE